MLDDPRKRLVDERLAALNSLYELSRETTDSAQRETLLRAARLVAESVSRLLDLIETEEGLNSPLGTLWLSGEAVRLAGGTSDGRSGGHGPDTLRRKPQDGTLWTQDLAPREGFRGRRES